MSKSSAAADTTVPMAAGPRMEPIGGSLSENGSAPTTAFATPRGIPTDLFASTARSAGRVHAGTISDIEHQRLLDERKALLTKKFNGRMTRRDDVRLQYVRWHLDRIDDARNGASLDELENSIDRYEELQRDLKNFEAALQHASRNK